MLSSDILRSGTEKVSFETATTPQNIYPHIYWKTSQHSGFLENFNNDNFGNEYAAILLNLEILRTYSETVIRDKFLQQIFHQFMIDMINSYELFCKKIFKFY